MIKYLLSIVTVVTLLFSSNVLFAQAPNLGTVADFVLFSSNGAVKNTGITHLTGNVGTNNGSSTGFGNVDGVMHDNDGVSAQCSADLLIAYHLLSAAIPTFFPAPLLGNGATLVAGIYSVTGAATLDNSLTLDAKGNANSVFIFQVQGALSTSANSQVILINGAKACNVFWKIEGKVILATGSTMKGTVIANNSAIDMYAGVTLEGRALSTTGAITVDGILGYTPIGCGSPVLTGPTSPNLATTACYALFSGSGSVKNSGTTVVKSDVGTNVGLTVGFDALSVTGKIHLIPDVSTGICAADLHNLYTYLNTLPYDINLLYPQQFGRDLVLTPHTYLLDAATILTDAVILNAQGNANAVFVIKINGALSTSTYSKVTLTNGAQAKNVFWKVDGAVELNNNSEFKGTIVGNDGAFKINTGSKLDGRAFTTTGELNTAAITVTIPSVCSTTGIVSPKTGEVATFYPNPFTTTLVVSLNDASGIIRSELKIYNILGSLVLNQLITKTTTVLEPNFRSGIYFYLLTDKNGTIQSGKLVSK
jgi:hypothetical protein